MRLLSNISNGADELLVFDLSDLMKIARRIHRSDQNKPDHQYSDGWEEIYEEQRMLKTSFYAGKTCDVEFFKKSSHRFN